MSDLESRPMIDEGPSHRARRELAEQIDKLLDATQPAKRAGAYWLTDPYLDYEEAGWHQAIDALRPKLRALLLGAPNREDGDQ